jgi:hypothetical protein
MNCKKVFFVAWVQINYGKKGDNTLGWFAFKREWVY